MLIYLFLLTLLQTASPFQTLCVRFAREFTDAAGNKDASKGIVYFRENDRLVVRVYDPINQVMVLTGKTMTIYYPDQKKAFEVQAETPFELPFVSTITAPNHPNYGLTEMGYQLEKTERNGDTLTSLWRPPANARKVVGMFKLVECRRMLLYAQSFKPNGQISTTALFSNYEKCGSMTIALDVTTYNHRSSGTETEIIHFEKPEFDTAIPDSILNFKIPPDTPMKHIQW